MSLNESEIDVSNIPKYLKYTESHEWVQKEDDGTLSVGLTDHAQKTLGDIVFLELPKVGSRFEAGDAIGVVESVKAASDIYTPLTGEVVAVNQDVADAPEDVNGDPYDAWLFRIKLAKGATTDHLLDAAAYAKLLD
ncbi:glycine cleavage system protein GcvH [Kitasatospora sp. NPDC089509]|uniref:glycine cleavage system protein GcvH n=1 Tax=Kitasatospora sp. NPDC089509 TaxID=3364079 RepID=UPI0038218FEF